MKTKTLLTACVLFISMAAVAGNPLTFISGKSELKSIMSRNETCQVVFDWSNTTYDRTKPIADEFGSDTEWIKDDCEANLVVGFNDKSKNLSLSRTPTNSTYKFVLTVSVLDSYYSVMRFVPAYEAKMWGNLKIVSNETGETIVEIQIDEAEDGNDMVRRECYGETFKELGERLGKLK